MKRCSRNKIIKKFRLLKGKGKLEISIIKIVMGRFILRIRE